MTTIPKITHLVSAMLVVTGLLLAFQVWCTWYFPLSVPPDGMVYLGGATHLATEGRFYAPTTDGTGLPLTAAPIADFMPGYSVAIALVMGIGNLDVVWASKVVNVGAYMLHCGAWMLLYHVAFGWRSIEGAVAIFLLALNCGLSIYLNAALSEMLFSASIGLFISCTVLALRARTPTRFWLGLIGSTLAAGAVVTTRYAGVGIVPGVAVGLYVAQRLQGRPRWQALATAALPCVVSALLIVLWVWRNLHLGEPAIFLPHDSEAFTGLVPRISDMARLFLVSTVGLPSSLGPLVLLVWVPMLAIGIGLTLSRESAAMHLWQRQGLLAVVGSLISYGLMIAIAGLLAQAYHPNSGFVRYFAVMQASLVGVVIAAWKSQHQLPTRFGMQRIVALSAAAMILLCLAGGIRRQWFVYHVQARRPEPIRALNPN